MWNAEGKMRNGTCGKLLRNGGYAECGKFPCWWSDAFSHGCRGGGGSRHIDQNIGLATFVCSSDLSCKFVS